MVWSMFAVRQLRRSVGSAGGADKSTYRTPRNATGVVTQLTYGRTSTRPSCNPNWSTKTIRPPASYTNTLKQQQLAHRKFKDKMPSHYEEEDHFISLELEATRAIRRTSGPRCGHARDTADLEGPTPSSPGWCKEQGRRRERTTQGGVRADADASIRRKKSSALTGSSTPRQRPEVLRHQ